jgi:hypothetical protein
MLYEFMDVLNTSYYTAVDWNWKDGGKKAIVA